MKLNEREANEQWLALAAKDMLRERRVQWLLCETVSAIRVQWDVCRQCLAMSELCFSSSDKCKREELANDILHALT